jgi:hypothetical protein
MVEYITNGTRLKLMDVTTIIGDKFENFYIKKKDGSFEAKPMKLQLCKFTVLSFIV